MTLLDYGNIAELPDKLKGAFWNHLPLANHVSVAMFADARYALYFKGSLLDPHRQIDRNECGSVVLTALRLCKSGKVGAVGICTLARTSGISKAAFSPFPDAGIYSVFGYVDDEFHLREPDVKRFRKIGKRIVSNGGGSWPAPPNEREVLEARGRDCRRTYGGAGRIRCGRASTPHPFERSDTRIARSGHREGRKC